MITGAGLPSRYQNNFIDDFAHSDSNCFVKGRVSVFSPALGTNKQAAVVERTVGATWLYVSRPIRAIPHSVIHTHVVSGAVGFRIDLDDYLIGVCALPAELVCVLP
jgi:hypothetical protein